MALPQATPEPLRVLVVDDDRDTTDTDVIILKFAGFHADGVYDAKQALHVAPTAPPHVVLLDMAMPQIDGLQLARDLRALPGMEDAVLICVSGYGTEEDRRQSSAAGCSHHIIKPIDWPELIALLNWIKDSKE